MRERAHGEERGARSEHMVSLVPSRSEARRGEVYIGLENPKRALALALRTVRQHPPARSKHARQWQARTLSRPRRDNVLTAQRPCDPSSCGSGQGKRWGWCGSRRGIRRPRPTLDPASPPADWEEVSAKFNYTTNEAIWSARMGSYMFWSFLNSCSWSTMAGIPSRVHH